MNSLRVLLFLFILSLAGTGCKNTHSQGANTETTEYIDPTVAAADHYKLLAEEGSVRVISMMLPAGQKDNLHSHRLETVYFIQGGQVKIHVGEEKVDASIPDGHVMFHDPWSHSVENTGTTDVRAVIFELTQSDSVATMEEYMDPVVASPDQYKELGRDGNRRVVHMKLESGAADNLHSHYYETVYFLKGGKVKIHVGDEVVEAEIPDGHVMFHDPWTHQVENVGETTVEAIIFEQLPSS